MEKFGMLVSKKRHLIVIIAIILAIPAIFGIINVPINYDILAYLPNDINSVKGQKILDEAFGTSNQGYLVFDDMPEYIIKDMEQKIESLDGVDDVVWVRDFLDLSVPKEMLPKELSEIFYRDNCVLLMVNFSGNTTDISTQKAVEEIRNITNNKSYLSGMGALIKDTIDISDHEKIIYLILAVVLAVLVLAFTLKSTIIPMIFLTGIGSAILYNMGSNYFLKDVSYITEAIAAVLQLGVTMDFSIFLYHRYEEEREKNSDHLDAMALAIHKTASSISGAALTTIAGFLALCAMKLTIGANIGIVMAKGVLIGVITTLTLTPALILIFDKAIHRFQHKTVLPSFDKMAKFVVKRHIILMIAGLLLLVPAIYGSIHTNVYYKLDESLPQNLDSIVSLDKLKNTYDMDTTHMIIVNSNIAEYKIDKMIKEIEQLKGISKVMAYEKVIGPMLPTEVIPLKVHDMFISNDYEQILVNSTYEVATPQMTEQINELKKIIKKYDENGYITGEGALTQDLIDITDIDFKNVNMLSILAVFIIILIAFKSGSIPLFLVAVIELAVSINTGLPFYTKTTIPFISTIVIGTIQLGTTVDYAILLTTRFREELHFNKDKFEAMFIALKSSARSIVTSGLTFFVTTVSVAAISKIDLISSLSGMIGRGALISMVTILFILPSVLLLFEGMIRRTTYKW